MKTYHIALVVAVLYGLFLSIGYIHTEGYGGMFNEMLVLSGMWWMGGWFQAALENARQEEEEEEDVGPASM
jgi:hypothetical protein